MPCYTSAEIDDTVRLATIRIYVVSEKSFFEQHMGGYLVGAAVVGFLASPVLPLISPPLLLLAGLTLASGITMLWDKPANRSLRVAIGAWGLLSLLIGAGALIFLMFSAAADLQSNGARCLIYEADMTDAHPKWGNSRDLFQALGCHPQPSALAEAQGHSDHIDVRGVPASNAGAVTIAAPRSVTGHAPHP